MKNKHAVIRFHGQEHDYDTIPLKEETEYGFAFCNPSKTALVISTVKTSCGCTVVEWNNSPVKPEKTGIIHVRYDAVFPGMFHKEMKVYYNGLRFVGYFENKRAGRISG